MRKQPIQVGQHQWQHPEYAATSSLSIGSSRGTEMLANVSVIELRLLQLKVKVPDTDAVPQLLDKHLFAAWLSSSRSSVHRMQH